MDPRPNPRGRPSTNPAGVMMVEAEGNATGTSHPLRLAVLLSGTGRTLENLLTTIGAGELDARVTVVLSSVPGVRGLRVAAEASIPALTLQRRDYADDAAYGAAIYAALTPFGPDLILLAGF